MDRGTRQDSTGTPAGSMDPADRRPFELAEPGVLGYHRRQVDRFMDRARTAYEGGGGLRAADIRHVSFDAVKGGYRADQVDDVLDRLEDALARADRERRIEAEGEGAWNARVEASVEVLRGRLDRPDGGRFRRPVGDEGYDRTEVDALCRRIAGYLDQLDRGYRRGGGASSDGGDGNNRGNGNHGGDGNNRGGRDADLTADDLRRAVFGPASGARAYDEAQVDAYLDAAIDVLTVLD